jgi:hypothetical protein
MRFSQYFSANPKGISMSALNIVAVVVAWLLTAFLSFVYFKAGSFKLTASVETLLGAGFAWVTHLPLGVVRAIAVLELLGVAGIILAPLASEFLGFGWAQPWGVAAAAGLTLTMLVAAIMHIVRGEFKYTYKNNIALLLASTVLTILLASVGAPLFA